MESSKVDTKKNPDGLSPPDQNKIIMNIICEYFMIWKKSNEIQ